MTTTSRYLLLTGLRWLPVGFLIPTTTLLALERGLSLSQYGFAVAAQGVLVLLLELPTGGLADAWGRRRVLLLASAFGLASTALLTVADSLLAFAVAYGLQGAFRALDSGPLEAWYVDATLASDPSARLERGLGWGSGVLSGAIALGALASGGLIALDPPDRLDALTLPIVVALGLVGVSTLGIATLMTDDPDRYADTRLRDSVRQVPRQVGEGITLVRGNRVLLALLAVELFWGFGMVTFEGLMPVRLADLVGDANDAAALMGPISSAGWAASAIGAATAALVGARLGVAGGAALTRVVQGAAVVVMGLVAGPIGLVLAYLATYAVHGTANPLHMSLLHREVTATHRSTVVSLNSLVSMPAGTLGGIALTGLADATSPGTAMVVGGVVLAVAAPLYLPAARRQAAEHRDRACASNVAAGSAK